MTKELTDEEVALALGLEYKLVLDPTADKGDEEAFCQNWWVDKKTQEHIYFSLPAFTTSLDAIVGEIERQGLMWEVKRTMRCKYSAQLRDPYVLPSPNLERADTAPLALCKALVEYMRKK